MMSKKNAAETFRKVSTKELLPDKDSDEHSDEKHTESTEDFLPGPGSFTPKRGAKRAERQNKRRRRKKSTQTHPGIDNQRSKVFKRGLTFKSAHRKLYPSKTVRLMDAHHDDVIHDDHIKSSQVAPIDIVKVPKPSKVIIAGRRSPPARLKSAMHKNKVTAGLVSALRVRTARKRVKKEREKHVENQFNSDLKINVLRVALETLFADEWAKLVVPVYATTSKPEAKEEVMTEAQKALSDKTATHTLVGYRVIETRVQEVNNIVAEYGVDAIDSRGIYGETLLHQIILKKKSSATPHINDAIARYLINNHPRLLDATYGNELYWGEVALHICAVNGETHLFKELIKCGADVVSPRAAGQFFMPFPQTSLVDAYLQHPAPALVRKKFRDSDSYIYYGEYVLSFAVANERVDMLDAAVAAGADIDAQDTLGNTAMHVVLYLSFKFDNNCAEVMLPELLRHGARQDLLNRDGYTPLVLATKMANIAALNILMSAYRVTNWIYGHVASFSYNLAMLDSFVMEPDNVVEAVETSDLYVRSRPNPPDDIEAQLGLEDASDAEMTTPKKVRSRRIKKVSSSEAGATTVVPIDDDSDELMKQMPSGTLHPILADGEHPDMFEFSYNDVGEDEDEDVWVNSRAGCCCLITQRQFLHIEALSSLETKAKDKTVQLKRWCTCCKTQFLGTQQQVPTVLTVAVDKERRDIIQTPVIKMIFDHKWKAFGQRHFLVKSWSLAVHLCILMLAVYFRPVEPNDLGAVMAYSQAVEGDNMYARLFLEALSLVFALCLVVSSLIGQDKKHPCLVQVYTSWKLILHAVCLVMVAIARVLGYLLLTNVFADYEPDTMYPKYVDHVKHPAQGDVVEIIYVVDAGFLCLAIIIGWYELLILLKGLKKIGLLIVTLEHMMLKELVQFLGVFAIIVIMFAQAFYVIYSTSVFPHSHVERRLNNTHTVNSFADRYENAIFVLRSALVPDDIMEIDYASTVSLHFFGHLVWIAFILISSILLLNLLIAIFNNKFNDFVQVADEEWFLQRAKSILRAERFTNNRKRWYKYMQKEEAFKERADGYGYALDVTV